MSDPAEPTPPAPPSPTTGVPAPAPTTGTPAAAPQWAPPAVAPFGAPGNPAPAAPGNPAAAAPVAPRAYAPPPGYTGPYGTPVAAVGPAAPGPALGLVALIVGCAAAVIPAVLVSVAAYRVGVGASREIATRLFDVDFDWSILTPVRDWVLVAELSFWVGTALGLWALVQGVISIVTNRGRGFGIGAVVVAALAPVLYVVLLQAFLTAGLAAGSG